MDAAVAGDSNCIASWVEEAGSQCAAGVDWGGQEEPPFEIDEKEPPRTDQRQVQRRTFLADPGDEPILTPDPIEQFYRFFACGCYART